VLIKETSSHKIAINKRGASKHKRLQRCIDFMKVVILHCGMS
jgi:hypothetical protein